MNNLTTTNFKVEAILALANSFQSNTNSHYMFVAESNPWPNDSVPPTPLDSVNQVEFNLYDNLLFGKLISDQNINVMTNRYDWQSNTIYTQYDDQNTNLFNENFFTVVNANTGYYVYKCLFNNYGSVSTVEPNFNDTTAADDFYITSDGYHWKYLYSINNTIFNNFATNSYIPVTPDANVSSNAISGAIDVILVTSPGANYNSYANGFFQSIAVNGNQLTFTIDPSSASNTNFYTGSAIKIINGTGAGQQRQIVDYTVSGGQKNVIVDSLFTTSPDLTSQYEITPNVIITGDGSNCQARAIINPSSNSIASIELTSRGVGYNWATAAVVGNTGLIDNSNTLISANSAICRVVIGPQGGHGANVVSELAINGIGLYTAFSNTENQTITINTTFRTFGIIQNPLFANTTLVVSNTVGIFEISESVINTNESIGLVATFSSLSNELILTDTSGIFNTGDIITGQTSGATATVVNILVNGASKNGTTFDQRTRFNITPQSNLNFSAQTVVYQNNANAIINESNSSFMAVTNVRGVFDVTSNNSFAVSSNTGISANITAILPGDLIINSGRVLYIENVQPIQRSGTLTETIKLVVGL